MFKNKIVISLVSSLFFINILGFQASASNELNHELTYENKLKTEALVSTSPPVTLQQQMEFEEEINEAYYRVEQEEEYIVKLINSRENAEVTSKSNWDFNLQYLQSNYEALKNEESNGYLSINFVHVDSYIEAYEFVALAKDMPKEKKSNGRITLLADSNYSIDNAVNYTETYYSSYNSSYPDWTSYGGDCANFISQALFAGGKK